MDPAIPLRRANLSMKLFRSLGTGIYQAVWRIPEDPVYSYIQHHAKSPHK